MMRTIAVLAISAFLGGCATTNSMGSGGSSGRTMFSYSNQYEEDIAIQLQAHANALRGYNLDDYFIGNMRHRQSYPITATVQRGSEIVITGACDRDCSDLDLIIYDNRGRELDRDTLVDDQPVLRFRAPYTGEYRVEALMYQCSVNPCYFGVALFVN